MDIKKAEKITEIKEAAPAPVATVNPASPKVTVQGKFKAGTVQQASSKLMLPPAIGVLQRFMKNSAISLETLTQRGF